MEIELGSLFFGFADLQIEADTADEFGWQVNRQESKPKMSITNLKWEFDLDLGIIWYNLPWSLRGKGFGFQLSVGLGSFARPCGPSI